MERSFQHQFSAKVGESVSIALPENANTGFIWSVNADDALEIEKDAKDLPEENVVGGGYTRIFNVSTQEAGTFNMQAELKQPWDLHEPPAEIHTFEFNFVD